MKFAWIFAVIIAIALSASAWGRKPLMRKPSSYPQDYIHLTVNYGEKISEFFINYENGKNIASFYSNMGDYNERVISDDDLSYLINKLKKLGSKLEATGDCSRMSIFVQFEGENGIPHESSACMDDHTKTAKNLLKVANLFAAIF